MGSCRYHNGEYRTLSMIRSSCVLHADLTRTMIGELEVDDESGTWIDHDLDCHGDPLDLRLMNDPVYKDGYMMSCCGRRPYELGCVISRHKPEV
jgi:hypothetical protein